MLIPQFGSPYLLILQFEALIRGSRLALFVWSLPGQVFLLMAYKKMIPLLQLGYEYQTNLVFKWSEVV